MNELHANPQGRPLKVAYIMSRFPKLTETFVLYEILALREKGISVEVFPLLRTRSEISHPEAERIAERAHYQPFVSWPIVQANWNFLRRSPLAYARVLLEVMRSTWGSLNFFLGALAIFPKTVFFARRMRELGIAHIHAHFANHPAAAAFVIHRLTEIPYSFTAHGSDLHVERRMLGKKIGAAAFAVTISSFNQELMVRECGESIRRKIRVIHCGVDPKVFSLRPGIRKAGDRLRILCVASFEEIKGHRYLIEACRILRERKVRFECRLVGDGPLRRQLQSQIRALGLSGHVAILGPRTRPEVARLLAESDAAVLASFPTRSGKKEGIPVALMEAMASGLPVVASATGGIPELVHQGVTGFVVPPGRGHALADALEYLAGDPDACRRMGRAGREKVLSEFHLSKNAEQLVALFSTTHRADQSAPAPATPETSLVQPAAHL